MQRVLLYCENMAAVYIVRAMVIAPKVIIWELCVLERHIRRLNVSVETRWLLSVTNIHADRPARSWYLGDLQVTRRVLNWVTDPRLSLQAKKRRVGF